MQTSDASNNGYPPSAMNIKKMSFVPPNVNSTTVDTVTRPDASFGFQHVWSECNIRLWPGGVVVANVSDPQYPTAQRWLCGYLPTKLGVREFDL